MVLLTFSSEYSKPPSGRVPCQRRTERRERVFLVQHASRCVGETQRRKRGTNETLHGVETRKAVGYVGCKWKYRRELFRNVETCVLSFYDQSIIYLWLLLLHSYNLYALSFSHVSFFLSFYLILYSNNFNYFYFHSFRCILNRIFGNIWMRFLLIFCPSKSQLSISCKSKCIRDGKTPKTPTVDKWDSSSWKSSIPTEPLTHVSIPFTYLHFLFNSSILFSI